MHLTIICFASAVPDYICSSYEIVHVSSSKQLSLIPMLSSMLISCVTHLLRYP